MIDENLGYHELSNMRAGRFSTPCVLLNDKYILAAGGQIAPGKNKFTNSCEIYDIASNKWTQIESMQKARSNTSMCAIGNRYVFIFHGLPSSMQPTQQNTIEYIDFVNFDMPSVKTAKWESMLVQTQEYTVSEPRGSSVVNKNEIIIFGGIGSHTFSFDISNVNRSQQQLVARINKLPESHLLCETRFCQDSDFTVRTFGNYMYAFDATNGNLHVFSIKDKKWNYSRLDELGIK